jgi:hypothetical protein
MPRPSAGNNRGRGDVQGSCTCIGHSARSTPIRAPARAQSHTAAAAPAGAHVRHNEVIKVLDPGKQLPLHPAAGGRSWPAGREQHLTGAVPREQPHAAWAAKVALVPKHAPASPHARTTTAHPTP